MSYDVWLVDDPEPPLDWNYTSNCSPMWIRAGADLREFHGKTAAECEPILRQAIDRMRSHPDAYKTLNPPNGWGDYDSVLEALDELLFAFADYPKAIVHVSH